MKKLSVLALLCSLFLFTGCVEKMLTFSFTQASNPELASDIVGTINEANKTITVAGDFPKGVSALKATFTFTGSNVQVGTTKQVSGVTANNFLNPVTYKVTFMSLFKKEYVVKVTNNAREFNSIQAGIAPTGDAAIVWTENGKLMLDEKRNGVWTHESSVCPILSLSGTEAVTPKVFVEPSGRTVIVWAQKVDGVSCIFKSDYKDGVWSHPANLDDHINLVGGDAINPIVTGNKNGFVVISYEQDHDIWGYEYLNGAWAGPWTLNNAQRGIVPGSSRFAMDANGYGLIVWREQVPESTSPARVYMRQLLDGANWSAPVCISTPFAVTDSPDIAMSDNGDAIIYWLENGGIVIDQFEEGAWCNVAVGGNRRLNPAGSSASLVTAAMNASGDAVLTWVQDSKAYKADFSNDIWNVPTVISNAGGDVTISNVAVLDIYYKWVLAFEQDNNIWGYVMFMDDTWGGPQTLNTDDPRDIVKGSTIMVTDSSNRGLIIWKQYGDGGGIFMREYNENAWAKAVKIN
ncbi:MAG TPA: hypothetical protein VIS94_00795 [Desulfomonilia bacterium]